MYRYTWLSPPSGTAHPGPLYAPSPCAHCSLFTFLLYSLLFLTLPTQFTLLLINPRTAVLFLFSLSSTVFLQTYFLAECTCLYSNLRSVSKQPVCLFICLSLRWLRSVLTKRVCVCVFFVKFVAFSCGYKLILGTMGCSAVGCVLRGSR